MPRRSLRFENLDAAVADAHALLAHGYTRAGSWDLKQVCEHLAIGLNGTMDGINFKAPLALRIMVKLVGGKSRVLESRQIPEGAPAPPISVFAPAAAPDDEAASVQQLSVAVDRYRHYTSSLARHPVFGKVSRPEWDSFHAIHCEHHLSFLLPKSTDGTA